MGMALLGSGREDALYKLSCAHRQICATRPILLTLKKVNGPKLGRDFEIACWNL